MVHAVIVAPALDRLPLEREQLRLFDFSLALGAFHKYRQCEREGHEVVLFDTEVAHPRRQQTFETMAAFRLLGSPLPAESSVTWKPAQRTKQLPCGRYTNSVLQRSCRCTMPSSIPLPSTTIKEVIFFSSISARALAANSPAAIVRGFFVIASCAIRSSTSFPRFSS